MPRELSFDLLRVSVDPVSPVAFAELGLRSGILPGNCVLDEQGWGEIDGELVPLETYDRAARKLLREQAAANPDSALAKELRSLEARRGRARFVMTFTNPSIAQVRVRRTGINRYRIRRSRRVRRTHGAGTRRARRGADPPGPEPDPSKVSASRALAPERGSLAALCRVSSRGLLPSIERSSRRGARR